MWFHQSLWFIIYYLSDEGSGRTKARYTSLFFCANNIFKNMISSASLFRRKRTNFLNSHLPQFWPEQWPVVHREPATRSRWPGGLTKTKQWPRQRPVHCRLRLKSSSDHGRNTLGAAVSQVNIPSSTLTILKDLCFFLIIFQILLLSIN